MIDKRKYSFRRYPYRARRNMGDVFLAKDKVDTEGKHPKCEKCPLVEICDNVQYNAKGVDFYCADNPRERRRRWIKSEG